jgi:hypothetical protein
MADYISCVEASGGNRQEISEAVTSEGTKQTSVKGEVKGKGVVVEGSGKLALDLSSEKNLVQKFEQRWFPAGMSQCAGMLDQPRRKAAERSLRAIADNTKVIADNTPTRAHPVLDLSQPIDQQIRLFATDEVTVVGRSDSFGTNAFVRIRLGENVVPFRAEDEGVRKFTVWGKPNEPMVPAFLKEDGAPLREGMVKLLVEYRENRRLNRDLREPPESTGSAKMKKK